MALLDSMASCLLERNGFSFGSAIKSMPWVRGSELLKAMALQHIWPDRVSYNALGPTTLARCGAALETHGRVPCGEERDLLWRHDQQLSSFQEIRGLVAQRV